MHIFCLLFYFFFYQTESSEWSNQRIIWQRDHKTLIIFLPASFTQKLTPVFNILDITNPVESWKRLITTPGQGHRARKVLFSLISNHSGVHRLCSRPSKETLISQPNPAWLLCYSWSSSLATISFSFCHGYSIANPFASCLFHSSPSFSPNASLS